MCAIPPVRRYAPFYMLPHDVFTSISLIREHGLSEAKRRRGFQLEGARIKHLKRRFGLQTALCLYTMLYNTVPLRLFTPNLVLHTDMAAEC